MRNSLRALRSPTHYSAAASGASLSPDGKGIADEPAPRTVRLTAGDLDGVYGHYLGRGYFPFSVHQRDVARPDNLLDVEVKNSLSGRKRGQLCLSPASPFFTSPD